MANNSNSKNTAPKKYKKQHKATPPSSTPEVSRTTSSHPPISKANQPGAKFNQPVASAEHQKLVAQTIQQKRAKFALEQVQEAPNDTKFNGKEFISYSGALPAMIHMNGLGQTAAFFRSKTDSGEHQRLYRILSAWLIKDQQPYSRYTDLLEGITQGSMTDYRLAQIEAIALMEWIKRFSKAFIENKEDTSHAPSVL